MVEFNSSDGATGKIKSKYNAYSIPVKIQIASNKKSICSKLSNIETSVHQSFISKIFIKPEMCMTPCDKRY